MYPNNRYMNSYVSDGGSNPAGVLCELPSNQLNLQKKLIYDFRTVTYNMPHKNKVLEVSYGSISTCCYASRLYLLTT